MLKLHSIRSFKIKYGIVSKSLFHSSTTNKSDKLRVLFFGTDDFASTHLNALIKEKNRIDSCIESIDLVCPPDRYTGRKRETITPSETKLIAEANNLEIYHTPSQAKTLNDWSIAPKRHYDLGVVVSFGYFIPPHIISLFKYGAVNVHPSLLPKYRGAAPIQHAIMYGDSQTGVTIQELDDREFDAGRILVQSELSLKQPPVYSKLKEKLASIGCCSLVETVRNLKDKKLNASVQDITKATKAPKVNKNWSVLNFQDMKAWQAEQLHRAIGEQYPLHTTYRYVKQKSKDISMQMLDFHLPEKSPLVESGKIPGSFLCDEESNSIHILFGDGNVAACKKVKLQNKGIISAKDFANGYFKEGVFGVDPADQEIERKNAKKRAKMSRFNVI